jgi:AraC-like DNA-binding protein
MQPLLDIFTLVIFLGVIQGVFLGVFFLVRQSEQPVANRMLGLLLLSLSMVILEVLLQYSGAIIRVIHLVNFSEPLNFAIGPFAYLAVYAAVNHMDRLPRKQYLHLLPLALYALYCVLFFIQPAAYKYDAFIDAYHPGLPYIEATIRLHPDPLGIRNVVNELTLLHLATYSTLALVAVRRGFRRRGLSFLSRSDAEMSALRTMSLQFVMIVAALLMVKVFFEHDLGDYIIATLVSVFIYATGAMVLTGSSMLGSRGGGAATREKYEKSSLTAEMSRSLLERLEALMATEKPYLDNRVSLPDLARRLAVSPHHLSQVLNAEVGQTFFEFIAAHRVGEAKRILSQPGAEGLRIEDVAEQVGYYSKSAFNTAFKKLTGQTPSQFRDAR